MSKSRAVAALLALALVLGAVPLVSAAEITAGDVYCFSEADFSDEKQKLTGICITDLPSGETGALMLGTRVVHEGDILTAEQVASMTFCTARSESDGTVSVGYLPVYEDHVAPSATLTIAIRGRQDKAPVAQDSTAETYKNLELRGNLKVKDPEGEPMTFTVTRSPKRGTVTIADDGSFIYTPKKNKVGVDSFTFTATDPAGNVSREATVTLTILKPSDATHYTDTSDCDCRFSAEWMKNTGIFIAECVAGESCFQPEKEVTRGEFVTMLVKALEIPVDAEITESGYTDEIPTWLRPYVAAAVRAGLTSGMGDNETFGASEPITGAEAAVMLQNALDLSADPETVIAQDAGFAATCIAVLGASGIELQGDAILTRADAAETLYRAVKCAERAPGILSLRVQ